MNMIARTSVGPLLLASSVSVRFAVPPATVLGLSGWKLTLPTATDRKVHPDEVVQPELATAFPSDAGQVEVSVAVQRPSKLTNIDLAAVRDLIAHRLYVVATTT